MKANLKIVELIKNSFALTTDDGEKVCNEIVRNFKSGKNVILDFSGLDLIISTFLNAAIGQLYGLYNSEYIRDNLIIINLSNEDVIVLAKVIERAKQYFKDKKSFENLIKPGSIDSKPDNKD